ncbi:MAG: 4-(cytidine 5'-diphospho)-2-C-methyl-D-erythritol kinase [Thiotrichaceae bacterium]|nr:4-(cytidine 5'-diphospho)-2-C-methyl-D-erythritol kinase [Thiotrichaceae bacterium]
MKLPAPAKLNLFLHITGQRDDGYHELQTVFQFLDYSDQITLTRTNDGRIKRLSEHPLVPEQDDLIIRAAKLLQVYSGTSFGVELSLEKKLPMGGGLGGGSSDAATVLLGCNKLWSLNLSRSILAKIGLQLGADIPVFIHGYSAWAEGVGEQLTPINPPQKWYLIVRPNVSISTVEIFRHKGLTRDCEPLTIADFQAGHGTNVLEPVVRKLSFEVDDAINWLSAYSPVRMTGSGSCIFASFDDKQSAQEVFALLPNIWEGFVAKGVNCSPLVNFV